MPTSIAILLALTTQVGHPQSSVDLWSQFRGPNGSGVAADSRPPVDIDPEKATWKVDVPTGHSSPVLSRQMVFLTAVEDDRLVTLAFRRQSGELVWRREAPEVPLEKVHEASSPAASTPCIDGDRVYVYFGSYGLLCYDLEGRQIWDKPITAPRSLYGTAQSPILHGDLLILVIDNDANMPGGKLSQSKIIALNKSTGELVWETPRPFHRSGWSTPTIWTHEGGQELVVLGNGRLRGYDATTGVEKWFVNGFSRETISRPIIGEGRVYASASMIGGVADEQPDPEPFWAAVMRFDANRDNKLERDEMTDGFTFPFRPDLPVGHPGFGMPLPKDETWRQKRLDGMFFWIDKDKDGFWTKEEFLRHISFDRGKPNLMAVVPGGKGDVTESHVAWALRRGIPEIPSPVLYQDRIYLACDGGILCAVDADNGEMVYRKRLGAAGHYRSSPVVANDHLYVISEQGVMSVVKTGDDFELMHQHDFGETVAATPAFDESTIYIRTKTHLFAFRGTARMTSSDEDGAKWIQSYDAGYVDANGAYAGGSEIMHLVPHKGKLYAANGYWMDSRWEDPTYAERQSAQVLRLDAVDGSWQVDLDMGASNDIGARYMKGNILKSVTFTRDGDGNLLSPPRNLLVMAAGNIRSLVSVWVRDDVNGNWAHSVVKSGQVARGMRWVPRDMEVYRDKVTGVERIFLLLGNPGIISGVYDESDPSKIRWDADVEFPASGTFSTRPLGIVEANGSLFFSVGGVIYKRIDGPSPTYTEVLNLGDGVNADVGGIRGLTTIANPNGTGESILFMWAPNGRSIGQVKRLDPDGSGGYTAHDEANMRDLMSAALGTEVGYVLGAHSNMYPFTHPRTGEVVHIIGFQGTLKGSDHLEWANKLYAGAMYAVRSADQTCAVHEVNGTYMPGKPVLVSPRTFARSPFGDDMLFVGGHDCSSIRSDDMAWIFRASLDTVFDIEQ